ncbi:MAG: hypothetical protein AB1898_07310 [Acidobacteriota bacterium]
MQSHRRITIYLSLVLVYGLTASGAYSQSKTLKDTLSIETLAGRALSTYLGTGYKGNGKRVSSSEVSSYLSKNKISLSKLPPDFGTQIQKGTIEGLLVPDVPNPTNPGTTGEVVLVRSTCLLGTDGCSRRGLLIQPPSFFGKAAGEQWCQNCTGCEGARNPPDCDLYDTCVCTSSPNCPGNACKKCPGC